MAEDNNPSDSSSRLFETPVTTLPVPEAKQWKAYLTASTRIDVDDEKGMTEYLNTHVNDLLDVLQKSKAKIIKTELHISSGGTDDLAFIGMIFEITYESPFPIEVPTKAY